MTAPATSSKDPRIVRAARLLRDPAARREEGAFVIDHEDLLHQALTANLTIELCFTPQQKGTVPLSFTAEHEGTVPFCFTGGIHVQRGQRWGRGRKSGGRPISRASSVRRSARAMKSAYFSRISRSRSAA